MKDLSVLAIGGRHQFAHFIPISFKLHSQLSMNVSVFVPTSGDAEMVRQLAKELNMPCPTLVEMTLPRVLEKWTPRSLHKRLRLLFWARRIRSADAILCAERTSTLLKRLPGDCPKLIHIPHGAGDRAIGFEKRFRLFDEVLVAGTKDRDRLIAENVVASDNCKVVGPIKFAAVLSQGKRQTELFSNNRPVLLYNPHFVQKFSSANAFLYKLVHAVARDGRYNLVVAPHVRLGQRWNKQKRDAWECLEIKDKIIVDLGSERSIDMTYTNTADLYIGDVSSQVYEFVTRPRPCLFVNSHAAEWQGNPSYAMWNLGHVVPPDCDPIAAIDEAFKVFPDYVDAQRRRARETLDSIDWDEHGHTVRLTSDPLARAADAVRNLLTIKHPVDVRLAVSPNAVLEAL